MITVTFRPGTHPDPEVLRKVVRDTDFTPTDIRFWIQGTIERRPAQDPADLAALVLVSAGSGQRFALTPAEDEDGSAALDALSKATTNTVTVWGTVTKQEGVAELILHVEGHSLEGR